jgi:hypothetical protein
VSFEEDVDDMRQIRIVLVIFCRLQLLLFFYKELSS